ERQRPRDAHAGDAEPRGPRAARRRGRDRVRPAFPRVHDPPPQGRAHHGGPALRVPGGRAERYGLPARLGRLCRAVHRDRTDGAHARRPPATRIESISLSHLQPYPTRRPQEEPRMATARSTLLLAVVALTAAACSSSTTSSGSGASAAPASMSAEPPSPDPRIGLGAGATDAEEAYWNMRKLSTTPASDSFAGVTNS